MNPYQKLEPSAFWKTGVALKNVLDLDDIWDPKFAIGPEDKVVTFGSCFAQHIGNALKARNYHWYQGEVPPTGMNNDHSRLFGYNLFSARTGNIYTSSLLKQWVEWALQIKPCPPELWEKDGRIYDPFRPRVEPDGFEDKDEMLHSREQTISSFKSCLTEAKVFVFTLGLTESWINAGESYEYPMCPGTAAGDYSEQDHKFVNHSFKQVMKNMSETIELVLSVNPDIKFLLTVSPVPLTATMSGKHVLIATMESKSILRAVAGQLADNYPYIDYFPSYEMINSSVFKGMFFENNLRNVHPLGVQFVMDSFFKCMNRKFPGKAGSRTPEKTIMDEICDDELLEAFGKHD